MGAMQDELLPSGGEWSGDRRKRLRTQVFLLGLEMDRMPACPEEGVVNSGPVFKFGDMASIGFALTMGLLIYGVAMAALVFGSKWAHQGEIMLAASIMAVLCLFVAACL